MSNLFGERPGVERLFKKMLVYEAGDEETQKQIDSAAEKIIEQDMAEVVYALAKNQPIVVYVKPMIHSNVYYGFDEKQKEIKAEVYYKHFTFCEDCKYFDQTDFNGGFCMRSYSPCTAHVKDGCTFGEKRGDKEHGNSNNG